MAKHDKTPEDIFCPIPFVGLYYKADNGKVTNCCLENHVDDEPLFKYENSLSRYWKSKNVAEKRWAFMHNQWPKGCLTCSKPESQGKTSARINWRWAWRLLDNIRDAYPDRPDDILDIDYGNITAKPVYFDYRPDNLCNLGCAMCSPAASSILVKMVDANPELDKVDVLPNRLKPGVTFSDEDLVIAEELGPHTRRIKLNGGEPTISARIKNIYKQCIDNDWAKNIELQFTTNFTNTNKTYDEILPHFKHISLTASLDGTGATYDYTRAPAKWTQVKKNIEGVILADKLKSFNFGVNLVWCATTCYTIHQWLPELCDLFKWVKENQSKKTSDYYPGPVVNQCWTPKWVALSVIPEEHKDEIRQGILNLRDHNASVREAIKTNPKMAVAVDDFLVGLDMFKFDPKHLTLFQNHITIYDKARKTDITQLHPRYKELLEYDRRS